MRIGFLGQGIMGRAMCANLLRAEYSVAVWNRTSAACRDAVDLGATEKSTPREVVEASDVTIAMVSDPQAARAVYFGADGAGEAMGEGKSYIDMSTVDEGTSRIIDAVVRQAGGRFLEAPVSGTKQPAIDGTLVILTAGDEALNEEATPLFEIMGKQTFFLGGVGNAANMKLIVNMVMGGMMTAFCEGLALAERSGLRKSALLDVLGAGALANPMFAIKGPVIDQENFEPAFPLKHMQKDLRLAGALGDALAQPLPSAAAANEAFIRARSLGLAEADFSAVYLAIAATQ